METPQIVSPVFDIFGEKGYLAFGVWIVQIGIKNCIQSAFGGNLFFVFMNAD